ncbi:MAG: hypothetical protein U1F36_18195 [Planctomycetota bacterium]
MNAKKTLFATATLLASFATLAPTTQAQSNVRSGYYSLTPGNSWMGGSLFAGASMQATRTLDGSLGIYTPFRTIDSAYDVMTFDASLRFLQQNLNLAYLFLSANSHTSATSPYDSQFVLYIRGVTERNQRFTTAGTNYFLSYYRTFDLFPTDPSASVSVYGVPVTVRGNVGVGVQAGLYETMSGPGYASLGGLGRAWGYGRVAAQAGWSWAGAGVNVTATFADTRLSPSAYADARNPLRLGGPSSPTIGGSIPLTIMPIGLRLDVWVALVLRYTSNLVNWSASTITLGNILF